jgi:hypothetical protein
MYEFNKINKNSYLKITSLSKKSFGINRELSRVEKKYDTSLFGKKVIGIMAKTKEDDSAALYVVFPIQLCYQDKKILVAQSGDTMTSPDHQRKGLFSKSAKLTFELAEQEGVKAIFGFPNKKSYPGLKNKLNWVFYGSMKKFTLRGSFLPLSEFFYRYRTFSPIYCKYSSFRIKKYSLDLTNENIKGFDENLSEGYVTKDLNYFNYKLRDEGSHLIVINGFKILIKTEAHLKIGVAAYFEESQLNNFLNAIKLVGKKMGCRKVELIMSKNHWLYDYLQKNEISKESLPIGFYIIDKAINPASIEFTQSDFDTF